MSAEMFGLHVKYSSLSDFNKNQRSAKKYVLIKKYINQFHKLRSSVLERYMQVDRGADTAKVTDAFLQLFLGNNKTYKDGLRSRV
jgi:hypothetical protein